MDLQFPDPEHGWALPLYGPAILRITQRGTPWQRLPLTGVAGVEWPSASIQNLAFPDRDTGYVYVADYAAGTSTVRNQVLKTTTAGQSWAVQILPFAGYDPFRSLGFVNGRRGVLVGSGGLICGTQDGGQTWQLAASGTRRRLRAVAWADAQTVYALGDTTTLLRSLDAGRTWQAVSLPTTAFSANAPLLSASFVSSRVGYLCSSVELFRTTDGGTSWLSLPITFSIKCLAFRTVRDGWALTGTDVYTTADAGLTWTKMASFSLNGVDLDDLASRAVRVDRYNAWVLGYDGPTILRYSEKYLATTPLSQTTLCTRDSLDIAFTREGTFSTSEQAVRVELSNARGRFRPGETRQLGQGTTSPVRVGVPAGLTASALYRIRIIRADSSVLGGDNGQDLRLIATPLAPLLATLAGQVLQATLPANSPGATRYEWEAGGATVAGATGAQLTPRTSGAYRVRACSATCCGPWSAPSVVVLATVTTTAQELRLYPNPARTTLWLERPASAAAATVQLLDVTGRVAWQGTAGAGTSALPVQQLPAGLYLVRLQTPTGPPAVLRVVVEH